MSTPADASKPWIARELMASHSPRDWIELAACAQTDPELFFPTGGQPGTEGKRVCMGCEVRNECLEYAITSPVFLDGIWGGMTPTQRRELRRGRGIKTKNVAVDQCGTAAGAKRHYRLGQKPCPSCRRAEHVRRTS